MDFEDGTVGIAFGHGQVAHLACSVGIEIMARHRRVLLNRHIRAVLTQGNGAGSAHAAELLDNNLFEGMLIIFGDDFERLLLLTEAALDDFLPRLAA